MPDVYRVNGRFVDKEGFIRILFSKLLEYPFSKEEFLSQVIKASPSLIKEFLLDGIVMYLKDNPNVRVADACKELKVHSDFIDILVEDGRVIMTPAEIQNLRDELYEKQNESLVSNKQKHRQQLANELKGAMNSSSNSDTIEASSSFRGYHYIRK